MSELEKGIGGTSIFDPVLCELLYHWFCPKEGLVLDPFAGGSVRGIIATLLGRCYIGIDLSSEQIRANERQAANLCHGKKPKWIAGDSRNIDRLAAGIEADFVLSCPPYANLEKYSDDRRDLSNMKYDAFKAAYFDIIAKTCALLKPDRFACFVVGEIRAANGIYRCFVPDTISAFQEAGLNYYNEAILVTQAGSLPMRARRPFETSRKLGKCHQNILVFIKGDAKAATKAIGPITCGDLSKAGVPS